MTRRTLIARAACIAVAGAALTTTASTAEAIPAKPALAFALADAHGAALTTGGNISVMTVPTTDQIHLAAVSRSAAAAGATASPANRAAAARRASTNVGSFSTDSTGTARLNVPMTADLAAIAAANDGWVNFEATAGSGPNLRFVSFSRRWNGTRWVARAGDPAVIRVPTARISTTTGSATGTSATPLTATATPAALTSAPSQKATVTALAGYPHTTCVWYGPVSTTTADTIVGELHTGGDTKGSFTYGQTADSDIEVGYKYGAGSWTASGTAHVGNSGGAVVGWSNKGPDWRYQLKSTFTYGKYEYIHDASCGTNGQYDYKVVPLRWEGGTPLGAQKLGTWCGTPTNRVQFTKDTHLTRNSARSYKFAASASAFGATVGSTSGYSTNVDFTLNFGAYTDYHWVCGNNAGPASSQLVWVQ